jgi:hypothetical protein
MKGRNFGLMRKHETTLPPKITSVDHHGDVLDEYVPIYTVPQADPIDIA